jgi:hypothetical protein
MRAIFILLLAANLIFFVYQCLSGVKGGVPAKLETAKDGHSSTGSLQLLSEQEVSSVPRGSARKESKRAFQSDTVQASQKSAQEFCTMLGPYGQLLQAEYAVERLNSLGVVARITPVEIKEGESYWVYLRPEMSEKEAVRRLYELQKKNIESHIIAKGELTNGISFGRFADQAAAEAKSSDIKKQGYDPEIKMLPKMIQETWVVIDSGFAEKIDETVWVDLISKEPGLEKRQNFCLGVASQ